jgi:hypothetical protein
MKLKTRLMMFTAAIALSASMATAAVDPQSLADRYVAEGYSFVEVKIGPTQTKIEAVRGSRQIEVVYDTATGEIIEWEEEAADDDDLGRTGIEISREDEDFSDEDDNDDDEDEDDEDDEDEDEDEDEDDDSDEDDDDRDEDDRDDDRDSDEG